MKNLAKLFVISILLFYSCDKNEYEYPDIELTVSELYTYCETDGKRPCFEPLNHEGDFVTVIGYYNINHHGYYLQGDGFRFFESPETSSISTGIKIVGDSKPVFDKISDLIRTNSYGEYVKIKVSGIIFGSDTPTNDSCTRGAALEIESAAAIR